ncbi:MAG: FecR family protein [Odoribacter splanchnicus]
MCLVQDRQKLILLLQKAYFGQLSEEEAGLLAEWRSRSSEHEVLYRRIMSGESLAELLEWQNHFDPEQANRSILHRVEKRRSVRMRKIGLRVAAIVLLLLGIGTIWIINRQGDDRRQQELALHRFTRNSPSYSYFGGWKAVVLDKKPVTLKLNEKQFLTGDSAILNYAVNLPNGWENNEQQTLMHKVEVPVGGEYRLVLADGTKVWINAESSLQYPVEFTAEQRTVILQGEAYFEVVSDTLKPFMVKTPAGLEVKVTGTHFNVEAYADRRTWKTTLVEGGVEVRLGKYQAHLRPNEQFSFDQETNQGSLKKVNVREVIAWKNGWFVFDNTPLEEIMETIRRWYNIEVEYRDAETKQLCFTGDLSKYDSFETVIRMFEDTKKVKLKVQAGRLIIEKY